MRPISIVSVAALSLGIAACSQAPAKAEEADTGQAEAAVEDSSGFNISFPGEETGSAGSADSGGFNFNIPDEPTQESGDFNLPTPTDDATDLPSAPAADVALEPELDDEPVIRIE